MKTKITQFRKLTVLCFTLLAMAFWSCSSDDNDNGNVLGNYDIELKVNDEDWKGNGQSAINDAAGNTENSFLLMTAYSNAGSPTEPEFTSMLSGASLTNVNVILMKGGFNSGQYFGLKYNGIDYVTNNAPNGLEVGFIKITNYGNRIVGELTATLYAEDGSTINVSEGVFSFDVMHF